MSGSTRAAAVFGERLQPCSTHTGTRLAARAYPSRSIAFRQPPWRAESADSALVVAALLHDIGHLIELRDDTFGYHKHDQSGGIWLTARLPAVVSEPVRLHVAAKRYLCTIEPDYFGLLSMPSQYSLSKQGGPMTAEEAADFARQPFIDRAVRLRRWDDRVKTVAIEVPPLDSYRRAIAMSAE
jgi:predicted HD phosphohydrolase